VNNKIKVTFHTRLQYNLN